MTFAFEGPLKLPDIGLRDVPADEGEGRQLGQVRGGWGLRTIDGQAVACAPVIRIAMSSEPEDARE